EGLATATDRLRGQAQDPQDLAGVHEYPRQVQVGEPYPGPLNDGEDQATVGTPRRRRHDRPRGRYRPRGEETLAVALHQLQAALLVLAANDGELRSVGGPGREQGVVDHLEDPP